MGEEQKMSVGVCIINRNGIALAADSAGTFSLNKMFYNSVNKLFSLSKNNVCGAIIYGNLSVYTISVEQIMKEFSVYLDSQQPLEDFYDIVPCFKDFLRNQYKYYKFDLSADLYCKQVISAYIGAWGKEIQSVMNEDDAQSKIIAVLDTIDVSINHLSKIDGFNIEDYIHTEYECLFNSEISKVVPGIDAFPNEKERMWRYICNVFCLEQPLTDDLKTGILFAGYGVNDAYPKFINIDLWKIINGELKYKEEERREAINNYAQIKPVAQEDVIYTFCKGISDEYIPAISLEIESVIADKIKTLPSSFTEEQKVELHSIFADCKTKVNNKIGTIRREKHVNPIIESVKLISLSEMAFLAENLINMTSLKRTYCLDGQQQTVGGPTDVAVLSKGDGFVWVKNKNILQM